MFKIVSSLIVTLFVSFAANAQMSQPVNWTFKASQLSNTEYQITLTANIEEGWYVYSQEMPNVGPIPTKIAFEKNPNIVFDGITQEVGTKKEILDANFNMNVIKLEGKTEFVQKVKIVGDALSVRGNLEFMTCNGQMCLPPTTIPFNIPLSK